MTRSRIEVLLIGITVLALSAGVVAGLVVARLPASVGGGAIPATMPAPGGAGGAVNGNPLERTPLAAELNLTPEQQVRMREIWEGVRSKVNSSFEDAQELQKKRDEALFSLLTTDEQKAKFSRLSKDFAEQFAELARARDKAFDQAVERTRKLLSDEQRKKYDEILKTHVRPPPPPAGPVTFTVPASPAPASQPAAH